MRRILMVVFGILVAGSIAAFAFFRFAPLAMPGVSMVPGACNAVLMPATGADVVLAGERMTIRLRDAQNCAMRLQGAKVQRVAGHLFIRPEYAAPSGVSAGCHCQHEAELRIDGLPPGSYRAHVVSWP